MTAKGVVFLTLEDEDGLINVIVRPEVYLAYRQIIRLEPLLVVEGKLQRRDGVANIVAEKLSPLRRTNQCQDLLPSLFSEASDSPETAMAQTPSGYPCHGHSSPRNPDSSC